MSFLRVKYKKLVSTFNELQCEKTAIQLQLESGSSDVKTIEANMKVWCIHSYVHQLFVLGVVFLSFITDYYTNNMLF